MRQDERRPYVAALARARQAAYAAGEYVGQESFMRASEMREPAHRAGLGRGSSVLDVCCGTAGPGRMLTAEMDCAYVGVDYSASALEIARGLAAGLPCRFVQGHVPPLPPGRFDVVLLLETMLAFPDKPTLLRDVAGALVPGGRFACTLEEGSPLTTSERAHMPDSDTVWLLPLGDFKALLAESGFAVTWQQDCTGSHLAIANALVRSFRDDMHQIADHIGRQAVCELVTAHELWIEWLGSGRVRKYAVVAEKR